ncbi:tRNA lysidine(34) synthetase TilS [Luteimonas sp. R10]|uniref:tRNA lysidine(34) synthetase TilS n=1 Tax=Luteimonas sp. R10 TaxID=3108176 RepID=UPI003090DABC|nr:tRNA lysidine(34) synthetase TilS [Luteimonas sp. R10]
MCPVPFPTSRYAHLAEARPLLVGYSGGLDSTVLLHGLHAGRARRDLRAIHVHHGLQPGADAWAGHCLSTCEALGVPLRIVRVSVREDGGTGPEAAARAARHAAFEAELRPDEVLALAHHRGDQAETFLLRALRASGVDGLAAMRPWRRYGRGWLWRPLLDTPRERLLDYARQHRLRWIEDPSNIGIEPDRNFLRHRVLPLLRERWPQADAGLARSARLGAEAAALLADEDAAALAAVRTVDPQALDVAGLQQLPRARRARVLRRWIDSLALPPLPAQGVARIEADLLQAGTDGSPAFAWSGAVVRRWRGLLHAERQRPPLPADFRVAWDGGAPLPLPTGDTLALVGREPVEAGDGPDTCPRSAAHAGPLIVRARRGGERLRLPGRGHSHALKQVLQALGVPPWLRERLPLLTDADDGLLAAGDLVHSAGFDAWLRARRQRLLWSQADPPARAE